MNALADINQTHREQTRVAQFANFNYPAAIPRPARIIVPIRSDLRVNDDLFGKWRALAARHVLFLSRVSLATVFFWFGALKVANVSPVTSLLRAAIPFLAETPYLEFLGIAEIVIGITLLTNRLVKHATVMMVLHLLGTLSLFVIAPRLIFAPAFPVLTMDGEFVLKNFVLITSALVIMLLRPPTNA